MLCLGALLATPALASGRPVIERLTTKASVTENEIGGLDGEIAIDAQIDPEGLETTYEIWLECATCGANYLDTDGSLPAVDEVRTVALTLHGLQPSGRYWVSVRARNSSGEAFQRSGEVEVPESPNSFPDGTAPVEVVRAPYLGDGTSELLAIAQREARERSERELKEQEARRAEERTPPSLELAERRSRETERSTHTQGHVHMCVVPSLRGDTLSAAVRALAKADCHLGRVSRPRHHRGSVVVSGQGSPPGKILRAGSRVAVTLAAKHAAR